MTSIDYNLITLNKTNFLISSPDIQLIHFKSEFLVLFDIFLKGNANHF